jgi:DNA invertase Pin-like site-specific DNA recombinase
MSRAGKGGKPALTQEQAAEAKRRFRLGRANSVKRIAADFGVDVCTVLKYARDGFRPQRWEGPK